VAQISPENITK